MWDAHVLPKEISGESYTLKVESHSYYLRCHTMLKCFWFGERE